jgi:hypothetical protein
LIKNDNNNEILKSCKKIAVRFPVAEIEETTGYETVLVVF